MELSILLFGQMVSMMLMILMGFAAVKAKLVTSSQSQVLSALTLYIIVPCVVINSFQIEFSKEKMNGLLLAAGFAILMHVLFILVVSVLGKRWKLTSIEKASMVYSNGGNLIIPLVSALLGQKQVFYCCAFIMVQLVFLWTHTVSLVGGREQMSWKKILKNPNMFAIAAGLILFFTNTRLPGVSFSHDCCIMDHQGNSCHSLCKRSAFDSVSGHFSPGCSYGNADGMFIS
nr:AEC family transporter [uncultured Blautia sp.]